MRVLGLAAVVITVVVLAVLGGFKPLFDQEGVERFLTESGPIGPIAYVLGFIALQPLSIPGAALILPATFIWPAWQVLLLSWLGGMVASTAGFAFARWLARDWVEDHLPRRFRKWDERIAAHGFRNTILLRVLTGFAPPADWVLGMSAVSLRTFLLGTAVGLAVSVAPMAVFGDEAVRLVDRAPLVLVPLAIVAAVAWWLLRRRRGKTAADAGEAAQVTATDGADC